MIALGSAALLRPWFLLLLPLLALPVLRARQRGAGIGAWARQVDADLLAAMERRGTLVRARGTRRRPVLIAAALALLLMALSGPAWRRAGMERLRNLDALLLLLDLSDPGRIPLVRSAALALLDAAAGRQIGIVLYAGEAYLAAPLTDDRAAAQALLLAVAADTVPDPGAAPARALALARGVLDEAHVLTGDVVLISGRPADEAAAQARKWTTSGVALHTLAVAPDTAARPSLARLARIGGGMAGDAREPQGVADAIGATRAAHTEASALAVVAWVDCGRFLVPFALLPVAWLLRRTA